MLYPWQERQRERERQSLRLLEYAKWLAKQGIPCFPVKLVFEDGKCTKLPLIRDKYEYRGDNAGGLKYASTDPVVLDCMWKNLAWDFPDVIGVPVGKPLQLPDAWLIRQGIVSMSVTYPRTVLDIDTTDGARKWMEQYWHLLPRTRIHQTRSGGYHVIFQYREGIRNNAGKVALGVDVRGNGGYIVWWPSIGLPIIDDSPPAPMPDWLVKQIEEAVPRRRVSVPTSNGSYTEIDDYTGPHIREYAKRHPDYAMAVLRNSTIEIINAPDGIKNDTLNKCTWKTIPFGILERPLSLDEIRHRISQAAKHAGYNRIESTMLSALNSRRQQAIAEGEILP